MKLNFLASFSGEQTADAYKILFIDEGEVQGRGWGIFERGLRASLPKFENVWVQSFRFEGGLQDHLQPDVRAVFPSGVILNNIVGMASQPQLEQLDGRCGITGWFRPATEQMRSILAMAKQTGKLGEFRLSVNGEVTNDANMSPLKLASGKSIQEVLQLDELYSTDMVTNPGRNGGFLDMLASAGVQLPRQQRGKTPMLVNQLKDLLKRKGIAYQDAPAPLQILASVGIVAAEGNEPDGMSAEDKTLLESIYAALTAGLDQVAATIMNAVKGDAPQAEPVQASAKPAPATDDSAAKARAIDLLYSKALVRDRLAESGLPEQARTLLASKFNGRVVTKNDVDREIADTKTLLAAATDSGKPKDVGKGLLASGLDPKGKAQIAMHKMLGVKPTDAEASKWQGVAPFGTLRKAYHEFTGDGERVTGILQASAFRAQDFPQALGDSMHRRLLQEYRENPVVAMNLVSVENNVRDFRSNYVIQMGGLEDLAEVTETGGYGEAAVPSDSEASYAVKTYGKHVRLSRVFIKNDSLNALDRIVKKIRRAATRSLNKYIFDLLLNYSSSINGGTIYDSTALYTVGHANLQTGAFSAANLWALRGLINAQLEADSSEPLDLEPAFLVVPKELEKDALIYLNSERAPGDTINDVNVIRMKNMTLMVVDKAYLRSDANNYYAMASPSDAEGIVMGFMDGQVEPELFLQDGPTEGNVFSYDHITYKVRHEYGGCVVDYRPLAAGIVT